MSRLAERIRNTEPWCAALLRGPEVVFDMSTHKISDIKFSMPWEPGFVFKSLARVERWSKMEEDGSIARTGWGCFFVEFVVALVRVGGQIQASLFENGLYISTVWLQEGFGINVNFGKVKSPVLIDLCTSVPAVSGELELLESREFCALRNLSISMALLECKNVSLQERKNPPRKRTKGRDRRQVDSYYVLDIPGSPRYWEPQGDGASGIHQRMHVCRGHFKTYTEDAPRLGRDVGTFWCPSHVRGNSNLGVIDKDYNLKVKA